MSNAAMIAEILAGGRVINRAEKMDKTIDVMAANAHKKAAHRNGVAIERDNGRGYNEGHGRKTGD